MRKEYNDRVSAELVNPGMTIAEYEASKVKPTDNECDCDGAGMSSLYCPACRPD